MLRVDRRTDILAVIDLQPTFMPGGELPVPEGDQLVPGINHLLRERFHNSFATQDWHPPGHSSFASAHPGCSPYDTIQMPYGSQILWPDHALQGSPNAALHPSLDQDRLQMILRKGTDAAIDSYSAFLENDRVTSTGLAGWLRDRGIRRVFFCGLAMDFCIAWSATFAVDHGLKAVVIEDCSRGIGLTGPDGSNSLDAAKRTLAEANIPLVASADLSSG
jgi:nicotinamidase/pyrazinamidase